MITSVPELLRLLDRYANKGESLGSLHNQLSLSLQLLIRNASEDEAALLSEVLSGMYEVEDGILDEETYRQALLELVLTASYPPTATVGDPTLNAFKLFPLATSKSADDSLCVVRIPG